MGVGSTGVAVGGIAVGVGGSTVAVGGIGVGRTSVGIGGVGVGPGSMGAAVGGWTMASATGSGVVISMVTVGGTQVGVGAGRPLASRTPATISTSSADAPPAQKPIEGVRRVDLVGVRAAGCSAAAISPAR